MIVFIPGPSRLTELIAELGGIGILGLPADESGPR